MLLSFVDGSDKRRTVECESVRRLAAPPFGVQTPTENREPDLESVNAVFKKIDRLQYLRHDPAQSFPPAAPIPGPPPGRVRNG